MKNKKVKDIAKDAKFDLEHNGKKKRNVL